MSNISLATTACPPPFIDASRYPAAGGYLGGRFCQTVPLKDQEFTCCLPCPYTSAIYPASFMTWTRVAFSLSAAGFALCFGLMMSWAFLPVEKSRRHYLSVCLVIGIMAVGLGFIIPLGVRPEECYDAITPNDMYSSLSCAFSGAFVIAGGLAIAVWLFIRVLSMHLQICWDIVPGKRFFYAAQAIGWGIVAILFTVTITVTGVSFRFGDACHVNSNHSVQDYWGPLLGLSGGAAILQLITFIYCINVYLRNMFSDEKTDTNSTGLPSYTGSVRTQTARAIYRRVRKVLWLQWRSILICVFILADIIFLSIVFVYVDRVIGSGITSKNMNRILPWTICLLKNNGEFDKCYAEGNKLLVSNGIVIAILLLLGLSGFQCVLLMGRWSMVTGWIEIINKKLRRKGEFVSLDAQMYTDNAKTYELMKFGPNGTPIPTVLSSPPSTYASPMGRKTPDFLSSETQREYRSPSMSFSSPKTPFQPHEKEPWDPRSTHARGGLGLHPPIIDEHEEVNSPVLKD